MGFLTGKPSKEQSGNVNNTLLTGALSPALGNVTGGSNMMGSLLGVNGIPQQTDALNNFAHSGGMDFLMQQMQKAVTSSKAAQGLLNSGSYGTALQDRGYGLASTYLNQYLQNLNNYAGIGTDVGRILTGSGAYSKGTGAKPGLMQMLAQGASAAAAASGSGSGGAGAAAAA